jgi:hypothetical protein
MTYEAYKAQMTRNRERLEENEQLLKLAPEDVQFFAENPLHVLVLTEDWCGDAIANVPIVGRLAAESGTLNVRIFLRDQNLDIMDQYLKNGQYRSIPVFVFFDQEFRELGHWIERPAALTEMQDKMLDELYATAPELAGIERGASIAQLPEAARNRLTKAFSDFRAETRELANSMVVRELRELVARNLAQLA